MAKKANLRPLGNQLIIIPDTSKEEMSAGGIYVPEKYQEAPAVATVIAVGPGLATGWDDKIIPVTTKIGEQIAYMRHAIISLEIHGTEYHVISESDVLFIIDYIDDETPEGTE